MLDAIHALTMTWRALYFDLAFGLFEQAREIPRGGCRSRRHEPGIRQICLSRQIATPLQVARRKPSSPHVPEPEVSPGGPLNTHRDPSPLLYPVTCDGSLEGSLGLVPLR
jgi:hypothetical protein